MGCCENKGMYIKHSMVPSQETIVVIISKTKALKSPMVKKSADFLLTQCSLNLFEY